MSGRKPSLPAFIAADREDSSAAKGSVTALHAELCRVAKRQRVRHGGPAAFGAAILPQQAHTYDRSDSTTADQVDLTYVVLRFPHSDFASGNSAFVPDLRGRSERFARNGDGRVFGDGPGMQFLFAASIDKAERRRESILRPPIQGR